MRKKQPISELESMGAGRCVFLVCNKYVDIVVRMRTKSSGRILKLRLC
jgi:hypothetical protein